MLSRGKVTPATVSYYSDEVARGIEDYYAGRGEAMGQWIGAGSRAEGLVGEVEAEELARLFDGCHPRTGESLGAPYGVRDGADRVTGWDLTFSSPKSVSALWAIGGGDIGMEVRDAHDAAVDAAVGYLEDHAAFSRTGKAGVRQVDTEGLLAAAFLHRSSRAGDPQLHTHVLVSGRVRCGDGVWRALDSRALHGQLKPAGMVYQAALRAELTVRLGVEWTAVDRNGQAEIAGVPLGLRRLYSQRRAAVEVRAAERIADSEATLGRALTPHERRRAFEVAVLETRSAKGHVAESDGGLHGRWRLEADAAGFAPASWIPDTVNVARLSVQAVDDLVPEVVAELAASRSTWQRADVVRLVARRVPADVGGAEEARRWVEATADAVLVSPGVVALTAPEPVAPPELRRRDGGSVFDRHGAVRYATLATLEAEQHVLDIAGAGRDQGRSVADAAVVEFAIGVAGLGEDQAAAVRAVSLDGDTVSCLVGPAGTGKSRAVGAAAQAWRASGIPVRGLAVSAVAAGVLAAEANLPSDTVAKFLFEHDRPGTDDRWRLRSGEVVVVDEAGMLASRDLACLTMAAHSAGAKVVLVGDYAQLGAVEAGGLFRLLADSHAVELSAVRRFTHSWERDASLALRARDSAVVAVYEQHGRVMATDRLGVLDAAAARWRQERDAGRSLVVCATDNTTVSDICDRVRSERVAAGEVEPGGVPTGRQVVGVGDEIVTTRNDRRLMTSAGGWVRNGDRWAVTARHPDGSLAVSHLDGHGRVLLPADYVDDDVRLAYALTIHKAQGVTVDTAVVVVDETTSAEALYVGMTRGRDDNTALVCCDALDLERRDPPATATDVLTAAVFRQAGEEAAITTLRRSLDASESLATLAPRLASVNAQIRRDTPDNPEPELARLAARRSYLERHARPGVLTRSGRDDRRLLRDLDQQQAGLEAARQARDTWLADHGDLFAYRHDLETQVAARRLDLGVRAAIEQPDHLVDLLGPVPADLDGRSHWTAQGARVEAYREQWNVAPDQLRVAPIDGVQHREWSASIERMVVIQRLEAVQIESSVDRGLDRGLGIEL